MKIAHVFDEHSSDWVALYIDGNLVYQDHSIEPEYILEYCRDNEIKFSKSDTIEFFNYDLDGSGDGFPEKFSNIDVKILEKYNEI